MLRGARRQYGEWAALQGCSFVPAAFTAMGAMGDATQQLVQLIARRTAQFRDLPYGPCVMALRLSLSFSLLRSALDTVLGPHVRQFVNHPPLDPWEICPRVLRSLTRTDRAEAA